MKHDRFELIYREYFNKIKFYIRNLSSNESLAEDLAQDTFFKIMMYLTENTETSVTFTWVMKIAHNLFIDYVRKHKVKLVNLNDFQE